MKSSKLMKGVLDYAESRGWAIARRSAGGNNAILVKPGRDPVVIGLLSTEPRSARNALADLKRSDRAFAESERQHNAFAPAIV